MRRETLIDFFADFASARGVFLVHDNGYRRREHSYADVARASRALAARLHAGGLAKGDAVILWSENRPEWVVALWACLLQGIVAVPIDYRASAEFLSRVAGIVKARVTFVGEDVDASALPAGAGQVWRLEDVNWHDNSEPPATAITRDDTAEIIFTSGAHSEHKGVVIKHQNVLVTIVPVYGEALK